MTGFVVLAGIGVLWATGVINPREMLGLSSPPPRAGMVPVPISARAIPAYTQVTRDHIWNPQMGELSVVYLHPSQIGPTMIRNIGELVGRVLKYEKPAGYVFTNDDFYPKGTRPGLVAGIPPGKRAIRVDAERVFGLQGLSQGDHFDLVSAVPVENDRSGVGSRKQASVLPLVQNGLVVQAVSVRSLPTTSSSVIRGTVNGSKPVQEVVIAVDPSEGVRLTEALAVDARILCLPRSGRPGEDAASVMPVLAPRAPAPTAPAAPALVTIETINGKKRDRVQAATQK
jgi:Flp pilus assembly protein CpaB